MPSSAHVISICGRSGTGRVHRGILPGRSVQYFQPMALEVAVVAPMPTADEIGWHQRRDGILKT